MAVGGGLIGDPLTGIAPPDQQGEPAATPVGGSPPQMELTDGEEPQEKRVRSAEHISLPNALVPVPNDEVLGWLDDLMGDGENILGDLGDDGHAAHEAGALLDGAARGEEPAPWVSDHRGEEHPKLDEPIVPDGKSLREFLLHTLEIYITGALSKQALLTMYRAVADCLPGKPNIPRTLLQLKRQWAFLLLDSKLSFYVACCKPFSKHDQQCSVCKKPLWTNSRPTALFFTRKVRPWVEELLKIDSIKTIVQNFADSVKNKYKKGVQHDILDGDYIRELIDAGHYRPGKDHGCLVSCDGFRPSVNLSSRPMFIGSLVLLGLPPSLRYKSQFIFTHWGVSAHVSNLNPFLDFALSEFYESVNKMRDPRRDDDHARLLLLVATCDCPAQRQMSGERAPGSVHGCEKCSRPERFAWRPTGPQQQQQAPNPQSGAAVRAVLPSTLSHTQQVSAVMAGPDDVALAVAAGGAAEIEDGDDSEGEEEEEVNEEVEEDQAEYGAAHDDLQGDSEHGGGGDAGGRLPSLKTFSYPLPEDFNIDNEAELQWCTPSEFMQQLDKLENPAPANATQLKERQRICGVNFRPVLLKLFYFDIKRGFALDLLHDVYLGPVRLALYHTFGVDKHPDSHSVNQKYPYRLPSLLGQLVSKALEPIRTQLPSEKGVRTSLNEPHARHQFAKGADLGLLAKLMPYLLESIENLSEQEIKAALHKPRSRAVYDLKTIANNIRVLSGLWTLLAKLCVIAESFRFDDARRRELLECAVEYNRYWKEHFGPRRCTLKVHRTLHLAQGTKNLGPLRFTWVFPFERQHQLLATSIRRRDVPTLEIARFVALRSGVFLARLAGNRASIQTDGIRDVYDLVQRLQCHEDRAANVVFSQPKEKRVLSEAEQEELAKIGVTGPTIAPVERYCRCKFYNMEYAANDSHIAVDTAGGEQRLYGEIKVFVKVHYGPAFTRCASLAYVEWFATNDPASSYILRRFVAQPVLSRFVRISDIVCRVALVPCKGTRIKHSVVELL